MKTPKTIEEFFVEFEKVVGNYEWETLGLRIRTCGSLPLCPIEALDGIQGILRRSDLPSDILYPIVAAADNMTNYMFAGPVECDPKVRTRLLKLCGLATP